MSVRVKLATVTGPTAPFILATNYQPFNLGLAVVLGAGSAGGTYNVEYSHNDPQTPLASWTWFPHPFMSGVAGTGNLDGNIAYPVGAVRLNVLSLPVGGTPTFTFFVRQAGQI